MFTSLRARLWLSYAFLIAVALSVVVIVMFIFLIRNPVLYRETQQRLRAVQTQIMENPKGVIKDANALTGIAEANNARVLLFDSKRNLVFDSNPEKSPLPFPRRNVLGRSSQVAADEEGGLWLFTTKRLPNGGVLVVAAPRPLVKVLNVFTDELLLPILEGGAIALLLSLVLAFGISRWVADPLQQVVVAARNYPQGSEASKPVLPRGPQEVQDLTRAFNSMISRVLTAQRSQRDFVANVSHELKTPLTSIQGFAQAILDDTAATPELRMQAAQVIYDEAGRMHRMALDLLDLARLEGGTADLKMSVVDIRLLLQTIVEKFSLQAEKAGVQVNLQAGGDLPGLVGDGDRLSQVFTNLVDNALKFTPSNGQVMVSAHVDQGEMKIAVTDSGQGIPADALPRLFDRFYQVDSSRAGGERHGAGLGLAIAQEIVQAHGGKIGVRSLVGHGTTIEIRLPLAQK